MGHSKVVGADMALNQEVVGAINNHVALKRRAADHMDLRPGDVGDITLNPVTLVDFMVAILPPL